MRDAQVVQESGRVRSGGFDSSFLANRMQVQLPSELLKQLTSDVPTKPITVAVGQPAAKWTTITRFRDGVEVDWGPLHTRMHSISSRATVGLSDSGRYCTRIEILGGRVEPISTTTFVRAVAAKSSRGLRAASSLSGGLTDVWFDTFARVSSAFIKQMDFEFLEDDGALLTIVGVRPVSLYLPKQDEKRCVPACCSE